MGSIVALKKTGFDAENSYKILKSKRKIREFRPGFIPRPEVGS